MSERIDALLKRYHSLYGGAASGVWSAPGRTELCGNHTDHQHGKVLAASVNLDMLAAAAPNGHRIVRIDSEGFAPVAVDLDSPAPRAEERGTTAALVRGICAQACERGFPVAGFDACVCSGVPQGSGLSSSAAFEVLIGAVVNTLFCGGALTATDLAVIGQRAENRWFGKPCGLMDQMASAWGGVIAVDFLDPAAPLVTPVALDLAAQGFSLCMIDLHADHANLTHEYAAIPEELSRVSRLFGRETLREADEQAFYARFAELRRAVGDRAALRAVHVFSENRRVDAAADALRAGDFGAFLRLLRQSGRSSWMYLQNIVVPGAVREQPAGAALALCESVLGERGAWRIHGGGFGGTVQAFVPDALLEDFRLRLEAVFGAGSCHVMQIRSTGFTQLR